jgi:putative DNA primase/helicase
MNAHTQTISEKGRAALGYVAKGWPVFPIMNGHKGEETPERSNTHHLNNGHLGASDNPAVVRGWWERWPDANIGLHLDAAGLVAVDADIYKPDCGWRSFIEGRDLPETLVQRSARGGAHYIFKAPPDVRFPGVLCPGVEIKHKGYILLEPSTFDGGTYRFENDDEPVDAPDWLPRREEPREKASWNCDTGERSDKRADDFFTLAKALDNIPNLDLDWETWNRTGMALWAATEGSELGRAVWREWSSRASKNDPTATDARWNHYRTSPPTEIGAGTIFYMAAEARRAREENAEAFKASAEGKTHGEDGFDLSHDALALDLGLRSWDHNARYVATWSRWAFWAGTHWAKDDALDCMTRMRAYLRKRAVELETWAERKAEAILAEEGDDKKAEKVRAWAKGEGRTLRSKVTVAAVEAMAQSNPRSAARAVDFDADLMILGTPGGTIDLRTGDVRPGRREDMLTKLAAVAPAPPGTIAPLWLAFLDDVFAGDQEVIAFMQRAAGYALTGLTTEHKLLFLYGTGRNGKSVFLDTLQWLLADYARRAAASTFLNSAGERHPTDLAGLHGARLVVGSELPKGKTWDESVIKDLTGGDKMTARFMRQDFFDFTPQLTLMIAGNCQPSFRGVDEAIRARVVLIPFKVTIPAERRDKDLTAKLRAEGPAILRWAIDGALAWQKRGLDVPASVAAASADYLDGEDVLAEFLLDCTVKAPGAFTLTSEIHARFKFWTESQGLGSWSSHSLTKELKSRGFQDARRTHGRGFLDIRMA